MEQTLSGKKVLILYTAHTMGHARIASNIGYWLSAAGATVVLREVLKSNPSPLVKYFLRAHVWVNTRVPQFWNFLYRYGFWVVMMPWRLLAAWLNRGEIETIVRSERPDLIITTQTSPSAVVNVLKWSGAYQGEWGIAFSDYHFHRAWMYPRVDFYLTNIPEQRPELLSRGVSEAQVFQMGFALPPREVVNVSAVRLRLGIPEGARVVLVGSGSLGVRMPEELFAACESVVSQSAQRGERCMVVVVCGRNVELAHELAQRAALDCPWMVPVGYYEPMAELYAIAELFITKPGGLSIIEAAQWRLRCVITHTLPGQEDINVAYLAERRYVTDLTRVPASDWPAQLNDVLRAGGPPAASIPDEVGSAGKELGTWVASWLSSEKRERRLSGAV